LDEKFVETLIEKTLLERFRKHKEVERWLGIFWMKRCWMMLKFTDDELKKKITVVEFDNDNCNISDDHKKQ